MLGDNGTFGPAPQKGVEATPRIELGMEVLQTSALPLGYVATKLPTPDSKIPHVSGRDFRDAMARVPSGVVVVSTRLGDEFRGLTASSLVSISLDPPLVLVGLDRESATRAAVLADRFAGRAPAVDWRTLRHHLGNNGIPLLDGCAAWLECRVTQSHPAGDHDIVIGEVESAEIGAGDPLTLWDRGFWSLH